MWASRPPICIEPMCNGAGSDGKAAQDCILDLVNPNSTHGSSQCWADDIHVSFGDTFDLVEEFYRSISYLLTVNGSFGFVRGTPTVVI